MVQSRKRRRLPLINYISVFDKETEKLAGLIQNITEQGMQLESDKPIQVDQEYHFWMAMLPEIATFKARSVWSRSDADKKVYYTGFSFVKPSKETLKMVRFLIRVLETGDHAA